MEYRVITCGSANEVPGNPCSEPPCSCIICQDGADTLRIFKNNLVCESCIDYIRSGDDREEKFLR